MLAERTYQLLRVLSGQGYYHNFLCVKLHLTHYTPRGYNVDMNLPKQKLIRRLKIIEGQVRGLQEMIENDVYCIDVITQTSAVKRALSGVEDALMESHLGTCLVNQIKKGKEKQAINETLKVYRLKRK